MGSSNSRAQRRSHVCSEPSVPHCFLLVLSLASFPPAPRTPSPHLVFGLPSSGHTSLSSFQRRGPTGRPAHVRKFQPREPTQARDSEQPVALEETETWLSVGGVVTGDLKSCHFLGSPEGTGRSEQPRDTLNHMRASAPLPKPCTSVKVKGCWLGW